MIWLVFSFTLSLGPTEWAREGIILHYADRMRLAVPVQFGQYFDWHIVEAPALRRVHFSDLNGVVITSVKSFIEGRIGHPVSEVLCNNNVAPEDRADYRPPQGLESFYTLSKTPTRRYPVSLAHQLAEDRAKSPENDGLDSGVSWVQISPQQFEKNRMLRSTPTPSLQDPTSFQPNPDTLDAMNIDILLHGNLELRSPTAHDLAHLKYLTLPLPNLIIKDPLVSERELADAVRGLNLGKLTIRPENEHFNEALFRSLLSGSTIEIVFDEPFFRPTSRRPLIPSP
ncbi:hypothetical protein IPJ72_00095 [Candidatus Peregrinibacteria bacterium]|nr:MAG: hypothetical protein IPJ72_00095 [Candidatus Peregrinibacteria bacterium]